MRAPAVLLGTIGLAVAAAAAPAPAPTPERALRCSKIALTAARGERDVVLVGSALAETRAAGAGDVRFDVGAGEDRDATGRAVRGQLVDVAALDGRTRAMLPAGARRVLLVPWAYGTDCRTYVWDDTRRWLEPGVRGLFLGRLRDRAQWADGVPTIDVEAPYHFPYTGRPRSAPDTATALTPDELLSLYDAIRGGGDLASARDAVRTWVREHPDLARRPPAPALLGMLREPGEASRIRSATPPLLGTWRLDASLDGAPPRTGWLRTWDRTSHADVERPTPTALAADPLAPPRVVGYYVFAAGDTALGAVPVVAQAHTVRRGGYVRVAVPDERAPLDAGPWRGALETEVLAHAFAGDSSIAVFLRDVRTAQRAAYSSDRRPEPTATFTRGADGTLRVEQRITLADGRTLVVRGARVSDAVIRDRPPAP